MGRRTRDEQRAYMAGYRSGPLAAAVNRWYTRTESLALRELARRHRGEYLRVLFEVREADPKPAATEESDAA